MLKIKKITPFLGKKVYTDAGDYFGEVEEVILSENKLDSWRMRITRDMAAQLNGARGVIIPHQFVKAVGDILIVNKSSLPLVEEPVSSEETSPEETIDFSAESTSA